MTSVRKFAALVATTLLGSASAQTIHEVQLDNGLLLSDWLAQPTVMKLTKPVETGRQAVELIKRYGPYRELLDVVYRASVSSEFPSDKIRNGNFEGYVTPYREARKNLGDWPNLLLGSAKLAVLSQDNARALSDVKTWLRVSPASDPARAKHVALVLEAESDPKALERFFAPEGVPTYIASPEGCKAYNPYPKPEESIRWDGGCVDGYISGAGTLTWLSAGNFVTSTTAQYERGRLMPGKASIKHTNGYEFEGEIDANQNKTGSVVNFPFKDSSKPPRSMTWSGRMVAGDLQGDGVWKIDDDRGKVHVIGKWQNVNAMSGTGTMSWTSGDASQYEGGVVNYHVKGPGVLLTRSGLRIEGNFDSLTSGRGSFTFRDGTRITGHFNKLELAGEATLVTPGGRSYVGEMLSAHCFSAEDYNWTSGGSDDPLGMCSTIHSLHQLGKTLEKRR